MIPAKRRPAMFQRIRDLVADVCRYEETAPDQQCLYALHPALVCGGAGDAKPELQQL